MLLADTLSRHYLENSTGNATDGNATDVNETEGNSDTDQLQQINQLLASEDATNKFREATGNDEVLPIVKDLIQTGWPENPRNLNSQVAPYFHIRDELATQEGLVFRGDRLVIPKSLRKQTLIELHAAHQGLESTTRRARETVYWPHINQELKDYIYRCETCNTYSHKQTKEPLITHHTPDQAWTKIGCDLFEFDKKMYMVTVDYYSDFFENDRLENPTAKGVIRKLKSHFARYGIPETVVTDNGPQFISQEFKDLAASYEFKHVRTSPYHHQSNGKAESAVKRAKRIMETCQASGDDPYLALLTVRNTPQATHETSPAQRLLNRRTKTRLPTSKQLLNPMINHQATERIQRKQELQRKYYNKGARELYPLNKGDVVRIQPTKLGQKKWEKGKVLRNVGIRSYEVESNGKRYTRNRRFLRKSMAASESDGGITTDNEEAEESGAEAEAEEPIVPTDTIEQPIDNSHVTKTRSGRVVRKPARYGT